MSRKNIDINENTAILKESLLIVKTYYKNEENFTVTIRKFWSITENFMKKFKWTFLLKDETKLRRHRPGMSAENVAFVNVSVTEYPSSSVYRN